MVIDIVFYIGVAQFLIGVFTFLINDYTVINLINYFNTMYRLPGFVDMVAYLVLLNLTTMSAIFVFIIPMAKYYLYEIYLELGNHGIDWELWTDITKSILIVATWLYSIVITGIEIFVETGRRN